MKVYLLAWNIRTMSMLCKHSTRQLKLAWYEAKLAILQQAIKSAKRSYVNG